MTYNVGATKTGPLVTNGVQAAFGFTFKIYDKTDIEAVYATTLGVETVIPQANYTIPAADLGKDNGGTVTFTNPALSVPAGTVTFRLNPPKSQQVNLRNQGAYSPENVERMVDRVEMQLLSMAEELSRAVKVSISSGINPADYLTQVIGNAAAAAASATAANNSAVAAAAAVVTINTAIASVTYLWGGTSTGSANAQVITTNPAPALAAGQKYRFQAGFTSTAETVTLTINGTSRNITKDNGSIATAGLAYGDIIAGGIYEVEADSTGTGVQLLNAYAFGESITAVASTATLNLSNTTGDFVTVSGATGITAVTLARGQKRTVRFTGAPIITNGASLVLPGGANLQVVAGDVLTFRNAAGVIYVENYQPQSGFVLDNAVQDFRLTLTSGTPVTTADVVGGGTVYCTPYKGNRIALYNGVSWVMRTASEFSLAISGLVSGRPYDVFCYDNAGVPTLEFLAWTSDTTRATALVYQDGVLSKSGQLTRRYLGTFYTTATTTTEDSVLKRYLYNYYNRVLRRMSVVEATANWTYTTAAYRQANNSATNQVSIMLGRSEDTVTAMTQCSGYNTGGVASTIGQGIGIDSSTVNSAILQTPHQTIGGVGTVSGCSVATYRGTPAEGKHDIRWLEIADGIAGTNFIGTQAGTALWKCGLTAEVWA